MSPSGIKQSTSLDPPAPSRYSPKLAVDDFDTSPMLSSASSIYGSTNNGLPPFISRAPVRYNFPSAPADLPQSEAELESTLYEDGRESELISDQSLRSLRPGQTGFAERLMSKYGWTKGSGLGAKGSGIVNPLRVQLEKQKKKPDSEGGGFVGPGGKGKIIGGIRNGKVAETGKFGAMSEVVILHGMVDGMDLDVELEEAGDGGLMQEIGEECGEKVMLADPCFSSIFKVLTHFSMAALRGFISTEVCPTRPRSSSSSLVSCRRYGYVAVYYRDHLLCLHLTGCERIGREDLQRQHDHR